MISHQPTQSPKFDAFLKLATCKAYVQSLRLPNHAHQIQRDQQSESQALEPTMPTTSTTQLPVYRKPPETFDDTESTPKPRQLKAYTGTTDSRPSKHTQPVIYSETSCLSSKLQTLRGPILQEYYTPLKGCTTEYWVCLSIDDDEDATCHLRAPKKRVAKSSFQEAGHRTAKAPHLLRVEPDLPIVPLPTGPDLLVFF